MTDASPWTIKRLLEWTTDYLKQHGASQPRLDAEVMLAHVRDCERIDLYARFDEVPAGEPLDRFRAMVKERALGKPVAYLVGYREFYSLPFRVTPDVLIPRPETEFLVVEALDAAKRCEGPLRIADVGTGSGCVAVTLAKQLPQAQITAIDISPEALAVARENAARHAVEDRITFVESDLFESVDASAAFEVIVSNPPYVGEQEQETLAPDVRKYEPHVALFGGADGMAVIQRLVPAALAKLAPGGFLFFELSPIIADVIERRLRATPGLEYLGMRNDLDGHRRIAKVRKPA